jgi:putative endonuclease
MYYTYILKSEVDGRYYIGQTQNLCDRLKKHNKGYSKYTKRFGPWVLFWAISFESRREAFKLEQKLKKKKSRTLVEKFMNENDGVPIINIVPS